MNKVTYFIVNLWYNGKYFAYVEKINNCENLARKGFNFIYCASFNVADSKTQAQKIVNMWNDTHKSNGELMSAREVAEAQRAFYSGNKLMY